MQCGIIPLKFSLNKIIKQQVTNQPFSNSSDESESHSQPPVLDENCFSFRSNAESVINILNFLKLYILYATFVQNSYFNMKAVYVSAKIHKQ